jgi:hypothetical protein
MARSLSERELRSLFTGRVVESLAVKQDFATGTIGCRDCAGDGTLRSGDRVTVSLTCYEDHSWEMEGVYCVEHAVDSVAETMGVRAENQAVIAATLEASGYHPPKGDFEPDALTLGAVEVLDYSPTAAGY